MKETKETKEMKEMKDRGYCGQKSQKRKSSLSHVSQPTPGEKGRSLRCSPRLRGATFYRAWGSSQFRRLGRRRFSSLREKEEAEEEEQEEEETTHSYSRIQPQVQAQKRVVHSQSPPQVLSSIHAQLKVEQTGG
jgi:hypothetical protein